MKWDLFINPIFGAIIGYGTNYLAIKMLFRPHKPVYIGKVKLPFTPGLIPKEKATLAKQMGEITQDYLLTEEMLVDTLTNPKAKEVFFGFMEGALKNHENVAKTIEDLSLAIVGILKPEKIKDFILPYVTDLGQKGLDNDLAKSHLEGLIDGLEEKVYQMLEDHAQPIGKGIIEAIGEGEEARKIKETIEEWVEANFNPMVAMFIKVDKIYAGMIGYASRALEDEDQSRKFGQFLSLLVKGLKESQPDYKDRMRAILKDQINDENINIIMTIIIDELMKDEDHLSRQKLTKIVQQALWEALASFKENPQMGEKVFAYYVSLIENNSQGVAELMNISNIVEDKINEYSSEEAEQVILSVVKKQLKGITWIGAILGAMIGIFSNFIR